MTAAEICQRHEALETERATWDDVWQTFGNYARPGNSEITERSVYPSTEKQDRLFDSTANSANLICAAGQLAYISPADEPWFSFGAPSGAEETDDVQRWYSTATETVRDALADSNFYTEIHEFYLDRSGFGTATILTEEDRENNSVFFRCREIGTYSIAESASGSVDTVSYSFRYTPAQAIQEFGEEAVSQEIVNAARDPKKMAQRFEFIHYVCPRRERDPLKDDPLNKPWASYYVEKKEKRLVRESGFDENPYAVSRWAKWGEQPYGYCPTWAAMPDIRQANLMQQYMDVLAEIAAFPRVKAPASMEGDVDLRASGITYYDPNIDRVGPEEWATQGRYDIGKDRVLERQQAIRDAYHNDLFKMFAGLDKQMTAREVAERATEKLVQFSPTFARLTSEAISPLLRRTFGILFRQGKFGEPPQEIILRTADGARALPAPRVQYQSKIALAVKALQNQSAMMLFEAFLPVSELKPDVWDNFNLDEMGRGFSRNLGLPEKWIRKPEMVEAIRAERQRMMEAQMAAEQAQQLTGAAKNLGEEGQQAALRAVS